MPDIKIKTPMPEQKPEIRAKNFGEVAIGYASEDALNEARRCLNCKTRPCVDGCPVGVDIPEFIGKISENDFTGAYLKIKENNALPAVCGRVCPQENQCEGKCIRGIKGEPVGIGRLERFAADFAIENNIENAPEIVKNGIKVAVVGAGPAGLTCAGELAKKGYSVTVFEGLHIAGGVLVYGIPQFRLPKEIVQKEIDGLKKIGVEIKTNVIIGKSFTVDELLEDYKAVFIGSGAGLPVFMNIEGETLNGVFSANEYLTRVNLMKAHLDDYDTPLFNAKKVAVVGGGNVAMDAARCALRTGAEVSIIYRRTENEMPARKEEIHHAKEEGINFLTLNNPVKIIGDENGFVKEIECIKMELGEPDSSGRRSPIEIKDSNYCLSVDAVIMAIGTSPNPLIRSTTKGLEANRRGCLVVSEDLKTTHDGVYAGGDAVTGAATVILAMGAGKTAAESIDIFLKEGNN